MTTTLGSALFPVLLADPKTSPPLVKLVLIPFKKSDKERLVDDEEEIGSCDDVSGAVVTVEFANIRRLTCRGK